jgi:hypothetical protein
LNCIRDKRLDAKNGGEIFPGQSNWFTAMETNADLHDVQRYLHPNKYLESWSHGRKNALKRFSGLDYIMFSRSTLSKITDIKVTPTLSDHRMLTLHLSKKQEKIGGPGYWQHPDHRLKDQDYMDTIDFALDAGLEKQTELTEKGPSGIGKNVAEDLPPSNQVRGQHKKGGQKGNGLKISTLSSYETVTQQTQQHSLKNTTPRPMQQFVFDQKWRRPNRQKR